MEPRWFRLLCLSFVVMRCQPLRRALGIISIGKLNEQFRNGYVFA
ncbi:superoxide dismutase [Vibrio cholerae]|nr:superoxide dismutase [Vibrio cholerae]